MKKLFNNKKEDTNNKYQEESLNEITDKKRKKKKRFSFKKINNETSKKVWLIFSSKIIGLVFLGFILGAASSSGSYTTKEYNELKEECKQLTYRNANFSKQVKELQEKVDEAAPWFEMKEEERKVEEEKLQAEKEAKAKAEEERLAAEAKAEEEAKAKEQAQAEAKEKQGYETGITYSQLARTPDDYLLEKVKFSGKVIQVMEGTDITQIRLAVGGNYDNIILGEYTSDIVSSRILEDDYITVYGISAGLITYESTMGGNITIPSIVIDKISE